MGVQRHYKKRFTKKSCRKAFTKNSTPKKIDQVFGRFLDEHPMRGVQKHDKKISKK
jgi:hypothetical protein